MTRAWGRFCCIVVLEWSFLVHVSGPVVVLVFAALVVDALVLLYKAHP